MMNAECGMMNDKARPPSNSSLILPLSSFPALPRLDLHDQRHLGAYVERARLDGRRRLCRHRRAVDRYTAEVAEHRAHEAAAFLHLDDADDAPAQSVSDDARLAQGHASGGGQSLTAHLLVAAQREREAVNAVRARARGGVNDRA